MSNQLRVENISQTIQGIYKSGHLYNATPFTKRKLHFSIDINPLVRFWKPVGPINFPSQMPWSFICLHLINCNTFFSTWVGQQETAYNQTDRYYKFYISLLLIDDHAIWDPTIQFYLWFPCWRFYIFKYALSGRPVTSKQWNVHVSGFGKECFWKFSKNAYFDVKHKKFSFRCCSFRSK